MNPGESGVCAIQAMGIQGKACATSEQKTGVIGDSCWLCCCLFHPFAEHLSLSLEMHTQQQVRVGDLPGTPSITTPASLTHTLLMVLRVRDPFSAPPHPDPGTLLLSKLLTALPTHACPVAASSQLLLPQGSKLVCKDCSKKEGDELLAAQAGGEGVTKSLVLRSNTSGASLVEMVAVDLLSLPAQGPGSATELDVQLPGPPAPASLLGSGSPETAAVAAVLTGAGSVPALTVRQYLTGKGLVRGQVVFALQRSPALMKALAAMRCGSSHGAHAHAHGNEEGHGSTQTSSSSSSSDSTGCMAEVVCMFQVVPWYVRPWLHTLTLSLDGQVVLLHEHIISKRIVPAPDRTSHTTWELCLHVPRVTAAASLSFQITKAFLTVPEYPPDAHRGFDLPPALFTSLDVTQPPAHWQQRVQAGGSAAAAAAALHAEKAGDSNTSSSAGSCEGSASGPGQQEACRVSDAGAADAAAGAQARDELAAALVSSRGVLALLLPTPLRQVGARRTSL